MRVRVGEEEGVGEVHMRDVTWGRGDHEAKDPHRKVTEGWVPSEAECQPTSLDEGRGTAVGKGG